LLDDRQSKSGAAVLACSRWTRLRVARENPLGLVRRDSDAGVVNREMQFARFAIACAIDRERDLAGVGE
jgi:hypothetical protein